jgi:molybdate transport system ATP-binding protein
VPSHPPASIVSLQNVDVDIDGRAILHGIQLAIRAGEHRGFVGANGSGKSTLLALIAGKRWPAPGRGSRQYNFGDGPETDAVTARERIALLGHELQDLYFARGWNFRVRDVVLSGLSRTDIPQRQRPAAAIRAANALLAQFRLEHLADRRILELSRGEQRRVLIVRALAFKPVMLLLDEPASGLDKLSRHELEAMLVDAASLTTLAIATHSEEELPAIVSHRAAIHAGGLVAINDTDERRRKGWAAAAPAPPGSASISASEARDRHEDILIMLERASVFIDRRPVLREIDWVLRAGEHWLVTGANGAGKSTLLRLLHAELRPAHGGSIRWPGLGEPENVWQLRRQIALVSPELQARYRYPTTVYDAIASGFTASIGRIRQPSAAQAARITELLSAFELDALADRLLSSLSYGQRHRALIARVLASEPRVLLLDEPWEGLDANSRDIVRRELTDYLGRGAQIICVSHVGAGGLPLNCRLVLEAGRIISAGGSDEPDGNSASAPIRVADSPPR